MCHTLGMDKHAKGARAMQYRTDTRNRQHDDHVWTRTDWLMRCILEALGLWGVPDFTDWYACGDELV